MGNSLYFGLAGGTASIVFALTRLWFHRRQLRRGNSSDWSAWGSVTFVAIGLAPWFMAAASISGPRTAGIWYLLVYVTGVFGLFSAVIAAALILDRKDRNRRDSDHPR